MMPSAEVFTREGAATGPDGQWELQMEKRFDLCVLIQLKLPPWELYMLLMKGEDGITSREQSILNTHFI